MKGPKVTHDDAGRQGHPEAVEAIPSLDMASGALMAGLASGMPIKDILGALMANGVSGGDLAASVSGYLLEQPMDPRTRIQAVVGFSWLMERCPPEAVDPLILQTCQDAGVAPLSLVLGRGTVADDATPFVVPFRDIGPTVGILERVGLDPDWAHHINECGNLSPSENAPGFHELIEKPGLPEGLVALAVFLDDVGDAPVRTLPDHLTVAHRLCIAFTAVETFPKGLWVGEYLDMEGSPVASRACPKDLYVGGDVFAHKRDEPFRTWKAFVGTRD